MNSYLTAARRMDDLAGATSETVDVLVVGGGITGVGVALDAASRGLSVVLVERGDLASGTSRWSSKLVHGGLRYLASGDVHLAYESARERAALLSTIAPHLLHPLPFVLPLTPKDGLGRRAKLMAGARAGEALRAAARTSRAALPPARHISAGEALRWVPALRTSDLTGGIVTWDAQLEDDARLVVSVARTAALHGARILTYVRALEVTRDGARVRDERTGETTAVSARVVVNATGVWADTLAAEIRLRPSKGTHVVLRAETLGHPSAALILPIPGEHNRYVFALPQPDGYVYLGLTDDAVDERPDVPQASAEEIDFLLGVASASLERPLSRDDVVGSYAGLRPLVSDPDVGKRTADLSRRHLLHWDANGVLSVVGGKLTTYRKMAEDTVDAVVGQLQLDGRPCRTRKLPLVGAEGHVPPDVAPRLARRYGAEAGSLAQLIAVDPELAQPVAEGVPVLAAEFAWGVLAEGALTVDDLLERRTRLSLVRADAEAARGCAESVLARYRSDSGAATAALVADR